MASRGSKRSQGGAPAPSPDRAAKKSDEGSEDANFRTIMGLDTTGGWHVLRVSLHGSVTADAAALKVLRQFFSGLAGWCEGLPPPLIDQFFESRDWGTGRILSRKWRRFAVVKSGLKLTALLIPDAQGGYVVLKTGPASAVADVSALPLTEREKQIVALVAAGKTNGEIGLVLRISSRTVQKHLENIFRKLGVETRTGLAMRVLASSSYGGA
jgi:DNA-binding CsgD family transcriptional regulator